ncbi:hypothetical protein BS78_05G078700 [Paspalum vaginatum]|nr:hypothetical protein BS78_05G078700 [Paspalum vaginatum]
MSSTEREERRKKFLNHVQGKCCNCFATNHRAAECRNATKCWRCLRDGHQASCCPGYKFSMLEGSSPSPQTKLASPPNPVLNKSFLQAAKGASLEMATYPGDPRARPSREYCAVSAMGAIKEERDMLVDKAVVCSHDGSSHDSAPKHVSDALGERLGIHPQEMQVMNHFPEQYFIIFHDPQNKQRVLHRTRINHRGRNFTFEDWSERRYGSVAKWEFRTSLRIEGIPVHAWNDNVAVLVTGRHCAIHCVDEKTARRKRTRTYDLWAWCSDPSKVPREVWLTITDPDRVGEDGVEVRHDVPAGNKYGLHYRVLIHMEEVDDLSFINGGGGGQGRKWHCIFEWHYGVLDHIGERRERGRQVERDFGHWHRDDDDEYDDRNHRRRRSRSVWDRVSHYRGEVDDCYSINQRREGRSFRVSTPFRRRPVAPPAWGQGALCAGYKLVWRPKKVPSGKRVSFANPLVEILGGEPACNLCTDNTFAAQKDREVKIQEMLRVAEGIESIPNSPAHVDASQDATGLETCPVASTKMALHLDQPLTKGKADALKTLALCAKNKNKKKTGNKKKKNSMASASVVPAMEATQVV